MFDGFGGREKVEIRWRTDALLFLRRHKRMITKVD